MNNGEKLVAKNPASRSKLMEIKDAMESLVKEAYDNDKNLEDQLRSLGEVDLMEDPSTMIGEEGRAPTKLREIGYLVAELDRLSKQLRNKLIVLRELV